MNVVATSTKVAEALNAWTSEEKEEIFRAILEEILVVHPGAGWIPVPDSAAPSAFILPLAGMAELTKKFGPTVSAKREQDLQRRAATLDDSFSSEEILTRLPSRQGNLQTVR